MPNVSMFTKIEAILILFQVPKIGYFQEWKNWGVKSCVAVPLMLCKSLRKVNKQTWQCTSIEENEDFNPIFWF